MDLKDLREKVSETAGKVLQTETARNVMADSRVQRALRGAIRVGTQVGREAKVLARELKQVRNAIRGPAVVDDDLAGLKRELDARKLSRDTSN